MMTDEEREQAHAILMREWIDAAIRDDRDIPFCALDYATEAEIRKHANPHYRGYRQATADVSAVAMPASVVPPPEGVSVDEWRRLLHRVGEAQREQTRLAAEATLKREYEAGLAARLVEAKRRFVNSGTRDVIKL